MSKKREKCLDKSYLNVVALNDGKLAVDDHELGVESAEYGAVVVDDLDVDVWNLLWRRKAYLLRRIRLLRDEQVVIEYLQRASSVVDELLPRQQGSEPTERTRLHYNPLIALLGPTRKLFQSVVYKS